MRGFLHELFYRKHEYNLFNTKLLENLWSFYKFNLVLTFELLTKDFWVEVSWTLKYFSDLKIKVSVTHPRFHLFPKTFCFWSQKVSYRQKFQEPLIMHSLINWVYQRCMSTTDNSRHKSDLINIFFKFLFLIKVNFT